MRVKLENSYKSDYKRVAKQGIIGYKEVLEIDKITQSLLKNQPLEPKYKDHKLVGDLKAYRECHIKPDLVLVYKFSLDTLHLVRIGSHSDLFKK